MHSKMRATMRAYGTSRESSGQGRMSMRMFAPPKLSSLVIAALSLVCALLGSVLPLDLSGTNNYSRSPNSSYWFWDAGVAPLPLYAGVVLAVILLSRRSRVFRDVGLICCGLGGVALWAISRPEWEWSGLVRATFLILVASDVFAALSLLLGSRKKKTE